jgi:hypothetical protein
MTQRPLPFIISARTVLVDVQTVRAARCVDAESVFALVDDGKLKWVFDFSSELAKTYSRFDKRELRFWTDEVTAPDATAHKTIAQVIGLILGGKQNFHSGEIEQEWVISHQTIMRLRLAGEISGGKGSITRASLVGFLSRRWLGREVKAEGSRQNAKSREAVMV